MTQYNSVNVKSNSQINKLKSPIKNSTNVILRFSQDMIADINDETNYPRKLLLTNRQISNIHKSFGNYLSTDVKLSKTQLGDF